MGKAASNPRKNALITSMCRTFDEKLPDVEIRSATVLSDAAPLPDATRKIVTHDERGIPNGFTLVSSPAAPGMVRRGASRARSIARALPEPTAAVILLPVAEGEHEGCSFAIYPLRKPVATGRIRRRIQQLRVRNALLNWKAGVTHTTAKPIEDSDSRERLTNALTATASQRDMPKLLREVATDALRRMETTGWTIRSTAIHNDFWWGNVVLASPQDSGGYGFQVVDWASATLCGFGTYDLLRMLRSLRMCTRQRRYWIRREAAALGCNVRDLRVHLAAGLGDLSMHLENFPRRRFLAMSYDLTERVRECT